MRRFRRRADLAEKPLRMDLRWREGNEENRGHIGRRRKKKMAVAGRLAGWLSRYYFVRARNYHDKAEIGCAAARAVLSSETEIQLGARARARAFGSARALRSAASGRLIAGDGRCKFALSIEPFPCISHPFFYFFSLSSSRSHPTLCLSRFAKSRLRTENCHVTTHLLPLRCKQPSSGKRKKSLLLRPSKKF